MTTTRAPQPYAGSRDPRFVTMRRGGSLDDPTHRALAIWAADCADHVIQIFAAVRPGDERPSWAIATARQWARGEVDMATAREAAYAAHAAAREATGAAVDAARAAGHAAATAHMADHELGPAFYALLAIAKHSNDDKTAVEHERRWQLAQLPPAIKDLVLDDMGLRSKKFRGIFEPNPGGARPQAQ